MNKALTQSESGSIGLLLSLVALPLLFEQPWWLILAIVVSGLLRWLWADHTGPLRKLIPALLAVLLTVALFVLQGGLFGQEYGLRFLLLMIAMKYFESQQHRDGVILLLLGCFLVLVNFLRSQELFWVPPMLCALIALQMLLYQLQNPSLQGHYRATLRLATILVLRALPFAVLLFLLFPRLSGGISLLRGPSTAISGFSDSLQAGHIQRLLLSQEIAFRVRFDGAVPRQGESYWRGAVLSHFDGQSWQVGEKPRRSSPPSAIEPSLQYHITLEAHNQNWLFALDWPTYAPPGSRLTSAGELRLTQTLTKRRQFTMRSTPAPQALRLSNDARKKNLQLPTGNPQARQLAQRIAATAGPQEANIAAAIIDWFRHQPFYYNLQPPLPQSPHRIDDFLRNKEGFCEHYASSMAFLLRAAGIPARVLVGYQGGQFNPLGDYLIVRQANAHAWVEAYLPDIGWHRFDATATISPLRIRSSSDAIFERLQSQSALDSFASGWRLNLFWDNLNQRWNQWVIGYDQQQRRHLWSRLWQEKSWSLWLAAAALLLALLLALRITALERQKKPKDRAEMQAWKRFCKYMEKIGQARKNHEGPQEYGQRLMLNLPLEQGRIAAEICRAFTLLRYAAVGNHQQQRSTFLHLVRQGLKRMVRLRSIQRRSKWLS